MELQNSPSRPVSDYRLLRLGVPEDRESLHSRFATAAGSRRVVQSQDFEGSELCQNKEGEWAQRRFKIRRNPGQSTLQR
jgi:hypothetical protein